MRELANVVDLSFITCRCAGSPWLWFSRTIDRISTVPRRPQCLTLATIALYCITGISASYRVVGRCWGRSRQGGLFFFSFERESVVLRWKKSAFFQIAAAAHRNVCARQTHLAKSLEEFALQSTRCLPTRHRAARAQAWRPA
jgi:hypothetical protein